jgi:hypothetical protein
MNWCDREVTAAWCFFVDLMEQRDPPSDVHELLVRVDHALLSEAIVEQCRTQK